MPLPKKQTAVKKPTGRKLSDLNLPQGTAAPGFVGDAQRTKVDDYFETDGHGKPLPFDANNPATHYSSVFDILNGEASEYLGKPTVIFLVRSHDDGEVYYLFMGQDTSGSRLAIAESFHESDEAIMNCRFHRIASKKAGQAPYVAIEEAEESDVDF